MSASSRFHAAPWVLVAGLALLMPFVAYPLFLVKALCFVMAACAFNLLLGGIGLLSLGHACFFGGGAYLAGWMMGTLGWPALVAVPFAAVAAGLTGVVFGWLSVKREGLFFSMVTLALAQFAYFAFSQAPFTGGDNGLQGVPRGSLLGLDLASDRTLYYVVLCVVSLAIACMARVLRSPFGSSMQLVKSNPGRALSLGYDVDRIKWQVFVLSAALTGLAGALKVLAVQFASLTDVHFEMSGDILMMAVIGGSGSLAGAVIGALFVVTLQEYFAGLGGWVQAVQGCIFAVVVLFFPGGLLGAAQSAVRWLLARLGPSRTVFTSFKRRSP